VVAFTADSVVSGTSCGTTPAGSASVVVGLISVVVGATTAVVDGTSVSRMCVGASLWRVAIAATPAPASAVAVAVAAARP
jgi:hypothetical protein